MKSPKQLLLTFLTVSTGFILNAQTVIPDAYIVILKPGQNPANVANTHGIAAQHVYTSAVNGFAGKVAKGRLQQLQRDPRVAYVEADILVSIGSVRATAAPTVSATGTDAVPAGVNRIDADLNPRTDVSAIGVAILDTGIDLTHPELNIAGSISYIRGVRSGNDDNGHGTHVAGITAAKINGNGIRGVAPNARLFAVKVLDSTGSGSLSAVVSGIDWVTKNAKVKGIKVANMSLGFSGTSATLNSAISKSVDSGVTYIVAAGNNNANATGFSPANHPKVITVSAMADSNGSCGGGGASTSYGADDSRATFSNYGSVVAIAAPGADIYSTYKNGGYVTMSGTSMAAPHVAGAAALLLATNLALTPEQVRSTLVNFATPQAPVQCMQDSSGRYRGGFSGDADGYAEPFLDAANL